MKNLSKKEMNYSLYNNENYNKDLDYDTLFKLEDEYNIAFKYGIEPINSGMISLVFKGYKKNTGETVIVKIKRLDIENRLDEQQHRIHLKKIEDFRRK